MPQTHEQHSIQGNRYTKPASCVTYFSPVPVKLLGSFPNSEKKWTYTLLNGNLAYILLNLLNKILLSMASPLLELQMVLRGETVQEAKDRSSPRSHTLLSCKVSHKDLNGGWILLSVSNLRVQLGEPKRLQFQKGTAPERCFCRWQTSHAAVDKQRFTLMLGKESPNRKHCQQIGSYFKGKFCNDVAVLQCRVLPNVLLADTLLFYQLSLFQR